MGIDRGLIGNESIQHVDLAIGQLCVLGIVGNHANGRAALVEASKKLHDDFSVFSVQVACRLVSQDDWWLADNGSGYRNALLLAAGKLGGKMGGPMAEFNQIKGLF
ncbi:hypothetical protein Y886_31065 [Xanthomonas hyacinthi DSM 19077]|nr:hypothetical protein Y886_31065 [Xanthomonas hyacinthi DSM 19077]